MSPAIVRSLQRSSLKIGGTVGLTIAVAIALTGGGLFVAILSIIGTAALMGGLVWSHWEHTPDTQPELILGTIAPDQLPADVAARMKETQT